MVRYRYRYIALLFLLFPGIVASALEQSDVSVLLRAKAGLSDPNGRLGDWNSSTSPCKFTGVGCERRSGAIISINLAGLNVGGRFPSDFCRIPTLQSLSLAWNHFGGSISGADVAPCSGLDILNLSFNLFIGSLPDFPGEFTRLRRLDLSSNKFSGDIPPSFGRFPVLQVLRLRSNLLSGRIPSFLANLTELTVFNLGDNNFLPGTLPPEIGNLTKLMILSLPDVNLAGEIPDSIGNLAKLLYLDLSNNTLSGRIPASIGRLRGLMQIVLRQNQLSGELPESLGNLSSLVEFDASRNNLTGKLPEGLAGLHLTRLLLDDNGMVGEIPAVLAQNPRLIELKLFNNSFSGELPQDLGRHSNLQDFDVSENQFVGTLPPDLCSGGMLQRLLAFDNRLSGELPERYGDCSTLTYVRIQNNELSGKVPELFWSLPNMYCLELRGNKLEGSLPRNISRAKKLTLIIIAGNKFSGQIPPEICHLTELRIFAAGKNQFSGGLPPCMTGVPNLQALLLQANNLSGEIPVGGWMELVDLDLSLNRFSGGIPRHLGELPFLTYLDLSSNELSGKIPPALTNLRLNYLNLSNNDLFGKIPDEFDNSFFLPSFLGNPNLCSCSDLKPFPRCRPLKQVLTTLITVIVVIIFPVTAVILAAIWFRAAILAAVCDWFRRTKKRKAGPLWNLTMSAPVGLDESEILEGLTEENLIGVGGSAQVYKVNLKSGQTVAVKRLSCGPDGPNSDCEFWSEVRTLGRVRHANIVKLLTCCSTGESRLLVFEYMENGCLAEALHGNKRSQPLDWIQRAKIALGVARALAYLHHDCVPSIVHRDLTPSNILLDAELEAKVGDFGLARVLGEATEGDPVLSDVVGSYGYIAPGEDNNISPVRLKRGSEMIRGMRTRDSLV